MQHAKYSNAMARELKVLRILERTPNLTQRQLAQKVGISLGGLNYCLNALMEKGFVKLKNFSMSRNKLGYAYIVTSQGMAEKALLTRRFLSWKMAEYETLRKEIAGLMEAEKIRPSVYSTVMKTR